MTTPTHIDNILTQDEINYILTQEATQTAKTGLVSGKQDFTLELPAEIRGKLSSVMGQGLDLTANPTVPFRWIKGDTPAHTDRGPQEFANTFLVYLTSSPGQLVIAGTEYPIQAGTGYVFNEGLTHETIGTAGDPEPRLLLGPMNELGQPVGGILTLYYPGGTVIYVREELGNIEYSLDQISWPSFNSTAYVKNINISTGLLYIEFITDITIQDGNSLFICESTHIQFGTRSLKNDGSRPIITIDVDNHNGILQNGYSSGPGFNHVYVYNLVVDATGRTANDSAGWLCQEYFGNGATNNYIINCSVIGGTLPGGSYGAGGIVGGYAGSGAGAELYIINCSSNSELGQKDGGIAGEYAGANGGKVVCSGCWHTGLIGNFAGGIFGDYAGDSGRAEAYKCYSTGPIGETITGNAGGIFGRFAGNNGVAIAENCYSRGLIRTDGGGIFGIGAGSDGGSANATNCYSVGAIATPGNGIYGTGKASGTATNCYAGGGTWVDAVANSLLAPPSPTSSDPVKTIWVYRGLNTPYELNGIGYTPYTATIILNTSPITLKTTFAATIPKGTATATGLVSGVNYEILEKNGGDSGSYATITINTTTGAISTTTSTANGVYTLYIRNTGSYNITEFELTVEDPLPCFTPGTLVLTANGYQPVETLQVGQLVITDDGRTTPIFKVHKSVVPVGPKTLPVLIPKDSLGTGLPRADFTISQNHLIRVGSSGWILPKRHFDLAIPTDSHDKLTYYHIELPDYTTDNLVINHGVRVESFCRSRDNSRFYEERYRRMNLSATTSGHKLSRRVARISKSVN